MDDYKLRKYRHYMGCKVQPQGIIDTEMFDGDFTATRIHGSMRHKFKYLSEFSLVYLVIFSLENRELSW